jgi:hypothetical protein
VKIGLAGRPGDHRLDQVDGLRPLLLADQLLGDAKVELGVDRRRHLD